MLNFYVASAEFLSWRRLFIAAIGFNVETVSYKNIKFQVWDLGGQTSIRPYWRCYYPNTQAIIYVVDSSDTERISISAKRVPQHPGRRRAQRCSHLGVCQQAGPTTKKQLFIFLTEVATCLGLCRFYSGHPPGFAHSILCPVRIHPPCIFFEALSLGWKTRFAANLELSYILYCSFMRSINSLPAGSTTCSWWCWRCWRLGTLRHQEQRLGDF